MCSVFCYAVIVQAFPLCWQWSVRHSSVVYKVIVSKGKDIHIIVLIGRDMFEQLFEANRQSEKDRPFLSEAYSDAGEG